MLHNFSIYGQSSLEATLEGKDIISIIESKGDKHFNLNQIITHIEDSILIEDKVKAPPGCTPLEELLFSARSYQHEGDFLKAIKIYKFLLKFEAYRSEGERLYIRYLMGVSMYLSGGKTIAYSYLKTTNPLLLSHVENDLHQFLILESYSKIIFECQKYEEAKNAYSKMFQISSRLGDTNRLILSRNNYGYSCLKLGDYDSASFYFRLNQQPVYERYNPTLYAFAYGNHAIALIDQKKYDSILYYVREEIAILERNQLNESIGNCYAIIGNYYLQHKKIDSATYYFEKSIQQSMSNNELESALEVSEELIRLSAMNSDDTGLIGLLDNYYTIKDSLTKLNNFQAYETNLQADTYLSIINELSLEKDKYNKIVAKEQRLIYLLVLISLVVTFMFINGILRRVNKKQLSESNLRLNEKNNELIDANQKLLAANQRNTLLIKELHHRVKNNLQMISSLFNLQSNLKEMDKASANFIKEIKDRVHSISMVHKKMYQSDQINSLEVGNYLRSLTEEMLSMRGVDLKINIFDQKVFLNIEKAIPLGLIFNELFINTIKHANTGNERLEIKVDLKEENSACTFIYTDNGGGITLEEIDSAKNSSFGIMMTKLLAEQIEARIEFKEPKLGEYGFWFSVSFMKSE